MEEPGDRALAPLLVAVVLLVAAPTAPLVMGLTFTGRHPAPFVAAVGVQVIAVGFLGWFARSRRRLDRRARAVDLAVAILPALGSLVALFLLLLIARGYGIRGSALPRVRTGAAFAEDIAYLVALSTIGLTVVAAMGVLLMLTFGHNTSARLRTTTEGAGRSLSRVGAALSRASRPAHLPTYVTGPDDPWLVRFLPASTRILLGLVVVVSAAGVRTMAVAEIDLAIAAAWAVVAVPPVVTVWAVLQPLWRPDEQLGIVGAALARTFVVPVAAVTAAALGGFAVTVLPSARTDFAAQAWSGDDYWEPLLPTDESTLVGWVALNMLVGLLFCLLGALATSVAVVLPVTALLYPDQLIRDNMMSTEDADRGANTIAVRALALLLPVIAVTIGLLVGADAGSARWWTGVVLAAVGVALVYLIWRVQRADHATRERWGVDARVGSPHDPGPSDDET